MSKKRMIIMVTVCSVMLIAILVFFACFLINSSDNTVTDGGTKWGGLFSSEQLGKLPVISAEKREEQYQERPTVPEEMESQFDRVVADKLTIGDFKYLDSYLYDIYEKYKDKNGGDIDLYKLSSLYRADINSYNMLTEENCKTLFASFRRPETLAAAIIYAPLSSKYNAFVNKSSLVMPPPTDLNGVKLRQADIEDDEIANLLSDINAPREDKFTALSIFDMGLYGLQFRLLIVQNADGYYQPYKLTTVNGYDHLLPTADVTFVQSLRYIQPNAAALDHAITYREMDSADFEKLLTEQRANPIPPQNPDFQEDIPPNDAFDENQAKAQ